MIDNIKKNILKLNPQINKYNSLCGEYSSSNILITYEAQKMVFRAKDEGSIFLRNDGIYPSHKKNSGIFAAIRTSRLVL
jgi:hypothetical protein